MNIDFDFIYLGETRNGLTVMLYLDHRYLKSWSPDDHRDALEILKKRWNFWSKIYSGHINNKEACLELDKIVAAYSAAIDYHLGLATDEPANQIEEETAG